MDKSVLHLVFLLLDVAAGDDLHHLCLLLPGGAELAVDELLEGDGDDGDEDQARPRHVRHCGHHAEQGYLHH